MDSFPELLLVIQPKIMYCDMNSDNLQHVQQNHPKFIKQTVNGLKNRQQKVLKLYVDKLA